MKRIVTVVVALAALGCAPTEEPGFTSVGTSGETGAAARATGGNTGV